MRACDPDISAWWPSLICAFKETFVDVLGDESIHEVLLQIKDEDWGGEFVDLQGDSVSDRAVVKVLSTTSKSVSKLIASEASLLHELAGAFLWYIYIKTEKTF